MRVGDKKARRSHTTDPPKQERSHQQKMAKEPRASREDAPINSPLRSNRFLTEDATSFTILPEATEIGDRGHLVINIDPNHPTENTHAAMNSNGVKSTRIADPQRKTTKKHHEPKLADKPYNNLAKKTKEGKEEKPRTEIGEINEQAQKNGS